MIFTFLGVMLLPSLFVWFLHRKLGFFCLISQLAFFLFCGVFLLGLGVSFLFEPQTYFQTMPFSTTMFESAWSHINDGRPLAWGIWYMYIFMWEMTLNLLKITLLHGCLPLWIIECLGGYVIFKGWEFFLYKISDMPDSVNTNETVYEEETEQQRKKREQKERDDKLVHPKEVK